MALVAALMSFPASPALALDGVWHDPTGIDDLYSTEPTERSPRDPMAGDTVLINATTWPIEGGQSVWVTWDKNGVPQTPIGASWEYNSGNNSYWQVDMGSFTRGDHIEYYVHADVNGGGQKTVGPFEFTVTSWSAVTKVTGHTDNNTSVDVSVDESQGDFSPKIRFAFPTTDSFRVQIAPNGTGLGISGITGYTVTDTVSTLELATNDLVLKIQKDPYRLSVYEGDGTTLITRQYDPNSFRNIGWASDGASTVTKIEDHYLTPSGERFEGFGERYDYLDQRGRDVHNYVYNQYQNQGSTNRTYFSSPFFINSAGYGIYIPSTRYSIFNIGTHFSDMAGFTTDTGGGLNSTFDYYFFTGTPDEIVDDYTAVSGRPQLPPKWAFGLWMSANEWNTQSEVEAELDNVETHDIPHTAMVLEQWSDEATFYIWHGATYTPTSGSGTLSLSDLTFPQGTAWSDPAQMVQDAHNQGIKVLLWQIPVFKENFDTNPSSPPQQHLNDKDYAVTQGYAVEDGAGGEYRIPSGQWFGDSMVPDFTDTSATSWWMSKRQYLFDDVGIDGFKTDGSEAIFGRDVTFSDGRKGDEMHNAYPNEYTDVYNSYVQTETAGDGAIFSRAGTAGGQGNSIFWAGDQASTFGAFQEAVRAGISAGQSGVPFWAWDMAGFTGGFPSAELYLRSAAMATFSPIMQYHSEKANPSPSEARTPWNVEARTGDSSVIPTFRKFANVRMNLIPYLYTEADRSATTGVPMMRAMSLEYPNDSTASALDQQYMFGESLLVAPITTEGAWTKDVYLAAGDWYDFWNGHRHTGANTVTYGASWDTIPVFVKAGGIVPLNLNADYELGGSIDNDVDNYTNLTFRIYPDGNSTYDYYEDSQAAHRSISVTEEFGANEVSITVPQLSTTSTLQVATTDPTDVTLNSNSLTEYSTLDDLKTASSGWYWDQDQQLTYVKLASSVASRTIELQGVNATVNSSVQRAKFASGGDYLLVEILDDDLAHFEISAESPGPETGNPVFTTPQVAKTDYTGPSTYSQSGSTITTAEMRIEVNTTTLCADVYHTTPNPDLLLHTVCPDDLDQDWKGLTFTEASMDNAYGLGQQFFTGGSSDGDWDGRTRTPGDNFGNAMVWDSENGAVGNTQIPVLFAVGDNDASYGLFVDQVYKQQWDLTGAPWTVDTWGDQIRWYVMTGDDLQDLRSDYLELTGRPPVPPKKALGLWVSEYGYEGWNEVDTVLSGLRGADFPVDGFLLDLFWFGGVTANSDNTNMGTLTWDTTAFPNPATTISNYETDDGVGIILIEESYVGAGLTEHSNLESLGHLVRGGCSTCDPVYLTSNPWWGKGGMIDWTSEAAGDYWHNEKRQDLVDDGIIGHWLDLGEPEMYDSGDWTTGVLPDKHAHADYHNIYNLLWAESIADGYEDNQVDQRLFTLTRSGAAGIQRHGVAMWSADIGSTLDALASQQNAQMHMSMSGIDYYGSDIGGFRREMLTTDLDELYTQWFANSAWFDVPVRPHVENLCNCEDVSPDEVGDVASNLANIRQRYELTPYYYSLAHRAYLYGEPVVPPLVFHFQNDPNVREMGHEKMIGKDLIVGVVAGEGERQRNIYLPAGDWINYHSNEHYSSTGQWYNDLPLWINGEFRLPAFARAGAILPKMFVDDQTMNVTGRRLDQTTRDELVVRVYSDDTQSSLTLYEDDGTSNDYQTGSVRTTEITQDLNGTTATVTIAASSGTYTGAPSSRDNVVELIVDDTQASTVKLNGNTLTQHANKAAFDAATDGWYNAGGNLVVAKSDSISVSTAKTFEFTLGQTPVSSLFQCTNGTTITGQSVYVVGNIPQLGEWSPASAVKLDPTSYPTWTGTITNLPPNTYVEWKCIKRQEANYPDTADEWEPGANNTFTTPGSGSAGTQTGGF
jgi:alpha-glucosidase (family GH31 glycosyl hydrolase)